MNKFVGLIIIFVCASAPAVAEIYKWTDDSGRVHFSDKSPGKTAEVVELKQEEGSKQESPSSQNSLENTHRFLRALEEEKAVEREKQAKRNKQKKKMASYCSRLKKEITIYEKGYAIVRYNDKGEHEYLTDQEIERQKGKFEQKWQEHCADL
ncbi:DUF4124 domain-containing protein [Alkalimarinus coralli]|uniref:DUF4124 domain-containing protein n=1 Tax=Alkalimarinus coralli TaxID=2935863 RepID=UPI00202B0F44|nr:DUF4124 domain-containing protein [Alkalimarinus coralli]